MGEQDAANNSPNYNGCIIAYDGYSHLVSVEQGTIKQNPKKDFHGRSQKIKTRYIGSYFLQEDQLDSPRPARSTSGNPD